MKESPAYYQKSPVWNLYLLLATTVLQKKNLTKASWKRDVGFSYSMKGYISTRKKIKREVSFVYLFVEKVPVFLYSKIHFKSDCILAFEAYTDFFVVERISQGIVC